VLLLVALPAAAFRRLSYACCSRRSCRTCVPPRGRLPPSVRCSRCTKWSPAVCTTRRRVHGEPLEHVSHIQPSNGMKGIIVYWLVQINLTGNAPLASTEREHCCQCNAAQSQSTKAGAQLL
jgi:hypothetical protein